MTATIYSVFETSCMRPSDTTISATEAHRYFRELMADGYKARFYEIWPAEPVDEIRDYTKDATEMAARAFLRDCNAYSDIPQWVYDTNAHDDWREEMAVSEREARREYAHHSALRANL